jgi:hypothetical protein
VAQHRLGIARAVGMVGEQGRVCVACFFKRREQPDVQVGLPLRRDTRIYGHSHELMPEPQVGPSGTRIPVCTHWSAGESASGCTEDSSAGCTLAPITAAVSTSSLALGLQRASRAPTASLTVGGTDGHPAASISLT